MGNYELSVTTEISALALNTLPLDKARGLLMIQRGTACCISCTLRFQCQYVTMPDSGGLRDMWVNSSALTRFGENIVGGL